LPAAERLGANNYRRMIIGRSGQQEGRRKIRTGRVDGENVVGRRLIKEARHVQPFTGRRLRPHPVASRMNAAERVRASVQSLMVLLHGWLFVRGTWWSSFKLIIIIIIIL